MEIELCLGGLAFSISSERPLVLDPEFIPFLRKQEDDPDIEIRISWDWQTVRDPAGPMLGEDLIQEYYREGNEGICLVKGGRKGYIANTCYSLDYTQMKCTVNAAPFRQPPGSLGQIMRFLPLRAALWRAGRRRASVPGFHGSFHNGDHLLSSERKNPAETVLFRPPLRDRMQKITSARVLLENRKRIAICKDSVGKYGSVYFS